MQARIIAAMAEVQVLGHALPQVGRLAHVDAHALVEPENGVEVDGAAAFFFEIAGYGFGGVEGEAVREERPDVGADGGEEAGVEAGVSRDPGSVAGVVLGGWVLQAGEKVGEDCEGFLLGGRGIVGWLWRACLRGGHVVRVCFPPGMAQASGSIQTRISAKAARDEGRGFECCQGQRRGE